MESLSTVRFLNVSIVMNAMMENSPDLAEIVAEIDAELADQESDEQIVGGLIYEYWPVIRRALEQRAEAALREYGGHKEGCPSKLAPQREGWAQGPYACNCGFREALLAQPAAKEGERDEVVAKELCDFYEYEFKQARQRIAQLEALLKEWKEARAAWIADGRTPESGRRLALAAEALTNYE